MGGAMAGIENTGDVTTANPAAFRCPRFKELPDMGLYLEQTLGVVNDALAPILSDPITSPMMNNYVKKGVVPAAVKKRYYREHLAYLVVMAILKPVFTVDEVARFYEIQKTTYPLDVAYDFVIREFENALHAAFDFTGEALPCIESARTDQTVLVRAMVLAAANHVFVEHYLRRGEIPRA